MSIFEKIKTIIGISDPEDEYMASDKNTAERHTPYINPFKVEKEKEEKASEMTPPPFVEVPKSQPSVAELDTELSKELVSKIIGIINAGLPDFIKGCIDQKAEAAYIRNNFGASLTEYSSRLQAVIERRAKSEWQTERMELEQQKASTAKAISDAKTKAEELLNKATSLERQKNALNERITLAEQKITLLEEENEKLKVENKGLSNKLKVAKLAEQEFNALKERNNELIENVKRVEELSAECEKLRNKIKEMEAEKEQPTRQTEIIASLQTEIKAQTDDLYRLKEAKIEADRIVAESKTAYSRLQSESSDKEKQAAARINELTELTEQKDREIDLLKKDLTQKNDFTEQLKKLIENNQIQQQSTEEKLKQEIVRLGEENKQLQKNLTQQKKKEKIDLEFAVDTTSVSEHNEDAPVEKTAQEDTVSTPLPSHERHSKKGRGRKKQVISAIDYSTDYSDWLMPTPPTEAIPIEAEEQDSDATEKDSKEDSDAPTQMELF